ncbi:hypothetical protein SEA_LAZERLEMON_69 [Streptomyces phage LazerLemon]|nr:hypothetical protein SEA_LAZERLEMON_69 [Streptomyces phage LazerLemon]
MTNHPEARTYLTAVVPDRKTLDHMPYVAVPLGPFRNDETERRAEAAAWLRGVYGTEDIRTVVIPTQYKHHDYDDARSMVLRAVAVDHERDRALRERGRQIEIMCTRPDPTDLDAILEILGVDPADV